MKCLLCLICCILILAAQTPAAVAQSLFGKEVKKKYSLRTVSCYTCHSRKSEIPEASLDAYKDNKKAFRNAFGEQLYQHLKGKDVTKRLAEVKKLEDEDEKKIKVHDEMKKLFDGALKEVEQAKSPSGSTYGDLLEKATLKGVKPKK